MGRLTELDIDYVSRQVPAEREARTALREAIGADTIPALRLENCSDVKRRLAGVIARESARNGRR
jgi:hypothetical protein